MPIYDRYSFFINALFHQGWKPISIQVDILYFQQLAPMPARFETKAAGFRLRPKRTRDEQRGTCYVCDDDAVVGGLRKRSLNHQKCPSGSRAP